MVGFWRKQLEESAFFGALVKGKNTRGVSEPALIETVSDAEKAASERITDEVLKTLSLPDDKTAAVTNAMQEMVRVGNVILSRSARPAEMNLDNSPMFGRKRDALLQALTKAGVGEGEAREAYFKALAIISEEMPKHYADKAAAKHEPSMAAPRHGREYKDPVPPPGYVPERTTGLKITQKQVDESIEQAKAYAAKKITFPDDSARDGLNVAIEEWLEARAEMLRLPPRSAVEQANIAYVKRGEIEQMVDELNPNQQTANAEMLKQMNKIADQIMGFQPER